MPQLGFKARFGPAVESGEKRQTIRAHRKRPFKVGDRLFLFTGMRTKQCRRLGEATATAVWDVKIEFRLGRYVLTRYSGKHRTPRRYYGETLDRIARLDGFENGLVQFMEFFETTHGLPFEGQLIRWGEIDHG